MKIGVDVGGTHTDAVIVEGGDVVAFHKALTSPDIAAGIVAAVRRVLEDSAVAADRIEAVMIGTTQFTNSVVERRNLAPVTALRIGGQSSAALPPFSEWPEDLAAAAKGSIAMIDGGHEYDGREIVPLNVGATEAAIRNADTAASFAVCGLFAPVNPAMENAVRALIGEARPGARMSVSHEIGRLGLIQRENATLINAALLPFSEEVVSRFAEAFRAFDLEAPIFLSQNDGTLMQADFARAYPVLTFSSGPTNSMRGAAFLSRRDDALVADVGGTTTDIGMLMGGFPRESGLAVDIGGVPSNFRMPDVLAIGLGGGTVIADDGATVGPRSVGHELVSRGLCFGGEVITATDIAVAAGDVEIGDAGLARARLDTRLVGRAKARIRVMLSEAVDRMKVKAGDVPLIAVGGGAFLIPGDLPGIAEVIRPPMAGVANAIGAAFAQVGGEVEVIYDRDKTGRDTAIAEATAQAREKAVAAGARAETVQVHDIDEVPLSYLAEPLVRLRIRAVGDLAL